MADNEIVAVVDENNRVIGSSTRREMRCKRLIHRATYIFVFNGRGELFVQKRTTIKDMYPGYYDLAAGGVVLYGESYELSAEREVAEELGVTNTALKSVFDFFYEDDLNQVWGRVFSCVYDGELVLQAEEVESGEYLSVEAIVARRLSPVTPDTRLAWNRYLAENER
jgi:isopentenyldiphosphate isomerase